MAPIAFWGQLAKGLLTRHTSKALILMGDWRGSFTKPKESKTRARVGGKTD